MLMSTALCAFERKRGRRSNGSGANGCCCRSSYVEVDRELVNIHLRHWSVEALKLRMARRKATFKGQHEQKMTAWKKHCSIAEETRGSIVAQLNVDSSEWREGGTLETAAAFIAASRTNVARQQLTNPLL